MADSNEPPTLASLRRRSAPPRRAIAPPAPVGPGLFDLLPPPGAEVEPGIHVQQRSENLEPIVSAAADPPVIHPPMVGVATISEQAPPRSPEFQTWTVSGLVRHVRGLVEGGYSRVTVEGEISNWRPAGSGHCYFTLKDAGAQLSAVLFRRQAALLRFRPQDGDAVKIQGQLSVFESRGQLQLIVEWMQQAGLGALLAAVQLLKEKLRREGLFDRKRPLPPFPRCIGVITSLQGAALRDIVKVCRRRHAAVRLLIYPAAVQGANCPAEVAGGLRWFNVHPDQAEVILLARGGGSWEDLHGFDHEQVARAIAASTLPVITGIGHATDSTIADAAADVCAPTPSAAAELLTSAQHRVEDQVGRLQSRLIRAGSYQLLNAGQRLARLGAPAVLRRVQDGLDRRTQRLDELQFRAEGALNARLRSQFNRLKTGEARLNRQNPAVRLQTDRRRLEGLASRLDRAANLRLGENQRRFDAAKTRLESLSPLRVLDRGYALVYGRDGHLLREAGLAQPGQQITARLAKGSLTAEIIATHVESPR